MRPATRVHNTVLQAVVTHKPPPRRESGRRQARRRSGRILGGGRPCVIRWRAVAPGAAVEKAALKLGVHQPPVGRQTDLRLSMRQVQPEVVEVLLPFAGRLREP
eukprot:Rmarinus@m.3613